MSPCWTKTLRPLQIYNSPYNGPYSGPYSPYTAPTVETKACLQRQTERNRNNTGWIRATVTHAPESANISDETSIGMMLFAVNDVKKALNRSVFEANLTPTKMPEHDDPTTILKDYFNTAMRTFFKFLREKGNNNPRDFKYIVEAHNNEDPDRIRKLTISTAVKYWGKETN